MTQITTVSTKGQMVIPAEMRESLGIEPGTRIAVTLAGSRIIIEPVTDKLVQATKGMFAGKPSLSRILKQQRREDEKKLRW